MTKTLKSLNESHTKLQRQKKKTEHNGLPNPVNMGALAISFTIWGSPYFKYSIIYRKALFIIKALHYMIPKPSTLLFRLGMNTSSKTWRTFNV